MKTRWMKMMSEIVHKVEYEEGGIKKEATVHGPLDLAGVRRYIKRNDLKWNVIKINIAQ